MLVVDLANNNLHEYEVLMLVIQFSLDSFE